MAKLFLIGTPIGNMDDITLRAIETLKMVDVLACEDTRVTRKLLNRLEIKPDKVFSYNDNNEKASAKGLIQLLNEGKNVGVVSDAGMPTISDPGFEIVRQCIASDIEVEVIPGVSATVTTLALSNFDTHFTFQGFLKPKPLQRQNQLKTFIPGTHIVFVSPHKLMATLEDVETVFGPSIRVFLGRELTKKFETHYRGTITEVMVNVKDQIKGEFTMALEVPKRKVNKYAK